MKYKIHTIINKISRKIKKSQKPKEPATEDK